jgi:hypothetical protein
LLRLVRVTREPQSSSPAEIALEALGTVVGGDKVTDAIDWAGPAIGTFYGQDWKSAQCITRANLSGGVVGLATTISTTIGGYNLDKKSSTRGAVAGIVGGLILDSMVYERIRARYMQTCPDVK